MKKIAILVAILPMLVMADNSIALTFSPGTQVTVTYTYTMYLTIEGPFGIAYSTSTESTTVLVSLPISTSIPIEFTPTAFGEFTLNGTLVVTANDGGTPLSTEAPFTMTLKAGETNKLSTEIQLPDGGSIILEVNFYIGSIPSPFLLAILGGGILAFKKRFKK